MRKHLESEAMAALKDTLRQVSVIKMKEMSVEHHRGRTDDTILGHIEIYNHAHLLACKVVDSCETVRLRRALYELKQIEKQIGIAVMPVLITSSISDEAQTLCRESNTGFIDLEGNARLYLDEVFIVRRSMPHHKTTPPPAETLPTRETAHFAQVA